MRKFKFWLGAFLASSPLLFIGVYAVYEAVRRNKLEEMGIIVGVIIIVLTVVFIGIKLMEKNG